MKRSLKHSFIAIVVLISILTGALPAAPAAAAAATMEMVPLDLPTGWKYGYLNAIWGSAANSVYAVGYGQDNMDDAVGILRPLIYYNGGTNWTSSSPALPPSTSAGQLYGVWGSGATDIVAVGSVLSGSLQYPVVYRGSNSGWTSTRPSLPTGWVTGVLNGVWGTSATNVYAVGYGATSTAVLPVVYNWNGTAWTASSPALPAGLTSGTLFGIWGSAANDIYAVGTASGPSASVPLVYHWNGSTWISSALTLPTGLTTGTLKGVWGTAANDVYVVGSGYNGSNNAPLMYRWDGSSWTPDSLDLPAGVNPGYLTSVWGSASSDVYVAGYGFEGNIRVPLLYHKDGIGWTENSPTIPAGWSAEILYGTWGSRFDDVYAVGTGHNGTVYLPLLYHGTQVEQDTTAPGTITDLTATAGAMNGSVTLSWTAPADDGTNASSGSVGSYLVKYSTTAITNWSQGTLVTTGVAVPGAPGSTQTMTVTGLTGGTLYHFAVRAQDEQSNLSADFDTASATAQSIGAGVYDDTNSLWKYSGQWQEYTGSGPLNNTLHYTSVVGSYAEMQFTGTKFTLTYTKHSNRGSFDVLIDGTKVTTINANAPSIQWQRTYTSPTLPNGSHTVRLVYVGGNTYIDVDAIQIHAAPTPVGVGTYDDTDSHWLYSNNWATYSAAGPANNSLHYTTTVGATAELAFTGTRFTLTFTKYSNRGNIDVFVDDVKVTTINASSASLLWQQTYASPIFTTGTHTLRLVHAGGATHIDVDAIQIFNEVPTPVGAGTYDDNDGHWTYGPGWVPYTGTGPKNNTLHYSTTTGAMAEFLFTGTRFTLTFTKYSNRGNIDVFVDDVKVTTISAYSSSLQWQQTYTSPTYTAGDHTLRLVHAGGATHVDIDAIQIFDAPPTPVTAGTYDDTDTHWLYNGNWVPYTTGSGPSNNTLHYTTTVGASAELTFTGTQFMLTYTKYSNRGNIDVYLDDVKVDTINANASSLQWQQTYTSPAYTAGNHTLRLVHAGGATHIDVDAIQIFDAPPPPVTAGTYQDSDSHWVFSSGWVAYTATGPSGDNLHYTTTVGGTAQLRFTGTQFILTFTKYSNRGNIDVYVDDVKITTISAYSASLEWQQTYTSPVFTSGTHTLRLIHAGGNTHIDVDAIQIK